VDLTRWTEELIPQSCVDCQPPRRAEVILDKSGRIRIPLVFSEKPRRPRALKNVALAASVVGGALSQQEIGKALDQQKPGSDERCVQNKLVALEFTAHPQTVAPSCE